MMQINKLVKIFLGILLISSAVFGVVTITTSDAYADCGFGYCESIPIQISKTGIGLTEQVYLQLDFENDKGNIVWAKNYIYKGKNKYELDAPFDLPNGLKNFDIEFFALGSGKFNVSVIGADTNFVYDVLDPFWSSDYTYRVNANITIDTATIYNNVTRLDLTSTQINYSNVGNGGDDFRITWVNDTTEQEINHWIQIYNATGTTKVWVELPQINASIYLYYGNNTEASGIDNQTINGKNTFLVFDDFEDNSLNGTYWNESSGTITENNGRIEVGNSETVLTNAEWNIDNLVIESRCVAGAGTTDIDLGFSFINGDNFNFRDSIFTTDVDANDIIIAINSGGSNLNETTTALNQSSYFNWNNYKLVRVSDASFIPYVNDIQSFASLNPTDFADTRVGLRSWTGSGGTNYCEWVMAYNYISSEITYVYGNEESEGDSTPPTANYTTPATDNTSVFSTGQVTLDIDLGDDTALENFTVSIQENFGSLTEVHTNTTTITGNVTFNIGHIVNVSEWNDGDYNITTLVFDTSNNNATIIRNFTLNKDVPEVTLLSPANDYTVQYNESSIGYRLLNFSYNVSSNIPLSYCALEINNTFPYANDSSITRDITQSFEDINVTTNKWNDWNIHCIDVHDLEGEYGSYWDFYINTVNATLYVSTEYYTSNYTNNVVKKSKIKPLTIAGTEIDGDSKLIDLTLTQSLILFLCAIFILMIIGYFANEMKR